MATGVGRGKMRLAAFDGPSPSIGAKISQKISQKSLTQAEL